MATPSLLAAVDLQGEQTRSPGQVLSNVVLLLRQRRDFFL
jgi:hypothetical protein